MVKTKVTLNVMDNISSRFKDKGFSNGEGKALVVFNGSNLDIFNQLGFVQDLKNNGFEISVAFSFMAEKLLDTKRIIEIIKPSKIFKEEDIFNLKSIIRDYSIVVGLNITMNTLSKVSLGMIDSFIPNILWSFLYHGKKVYLNFHSVRNFMGQPPKSKELGMVIENHIENVLKMGALEISTGVEQSTNVVTDNKSIKTLITQREISKLDKNQRVLVLNKGTIITPLAKDKARELGISIEIK